MSCCYGWRIRSYATNGRAAPTRNAVPPAVKAGWSRHPKAVVVVLNQSKSGIYIDTGLGSATNTVIPENAGIQETVQNVLSWTLAYAGVTKVWLFQFAQSNTLRIAEAGSGV